MDIKDIQNLIKFVAKSGAQEVKLEMEDVKITIKTGPKSSVTENGGFLQNLSAVPPSTVSQVNPTNLQVSNELDSLKAEEKIVSEDHLITIKSPIIGTFYRKAAPDKPAFIEIGSSSKEGDVLCVIEAMKLFNEIESEISGTIVKILVDDASPVEFDQPLFVINPA